MSRPAAPHGTKQCSSCGERKPLRDFHVERRAVDGRRRQCRACLRAKALSYYRVVTRPTRTQRDVEPIPTGTHCPVHGLPLLYGTSGRGSAVEYCPTCGERPIPVRRPA